MAISEGKRKIRMKKIFITVFLIGLIILCVWVTLNNYNTEREQEEKNRNYATYSGTHHFSEREYSLLKDYIASPEYVLKEKNYLLNSEDPVIEFKVKTLIENEFPWGEKKIGEPGSKIIDWIVSIFISSLIFVMGIFLITVIVGFNRYAG